MDRDFPEFTEKEYTVLMEALEGYRLHQQWTSRNKNLTADTRSRARTKWAAIDRVCNKLHEV